MHPDLIMMDLRMPVKDGNEATLRIKSLPGGEKTAIIMVPANVMEDDKRKAIENGAAGFIPKPFKQDELFKEIKRVCNIEYFYEKIESKELTSDENISFSMDSISDFPPYF